MSDQIAPVTSPPTPAARLIRAGWLWSILNSVLSVVIFLALWEGLIRLFDVPVWLVPKPSDFLGRFLVDYPEILRNALATSVTLAAGFGLGVVIAVPLALLMVSIGALERGLYPVIVFLNIMPKTVIGPILIIWFGVSPLVSVLVVFLMCFFPVLVDSMHGFRAVDPRLDYITRSMGATPWQAFRYVRLPASMSHIFAGMRIGIVKAVEGVIIAEFIGSSAGLGFMIMRASSFMNMELLFCGLVAVAIVALIFNALLATSERIMMPWVRPR
ncbi:MAG: ABC transporter permease [Proteobacteria bacterium]|nr:ABC transporter permease [Pseudomonadota bacterium]